MVGADPGSGAFALEWIDGRTMSNAAFAAEPRAVKLIAAALLRLHTGPRFRDDFNMFRLTERYLGVVDERGLRIPDGYREHLPAIPRIDAALAAHPPRPCPAITTCSRRTTSTAGPGAG